jgi:hypothetical protein
MTSPILFPIQYQRQSAVPIDVDSIFDTSANRLTYLSNPRRYAGQVVSDTELNAVFVLNDSRDSWIRIGPSSSDILDPSTLVFPTLGEPTVLPSESISMFFTSRQLNDYYPEFLTKDDQDFGSTSDALTSNTGISMPIGYCAHVNMQVFVTTVDAGRKLYKTNQLTFTVMPKTYASPDSISISSLVSTVLGESSYMDGVTITIYCYGDQFWPTVSSDHAIGGDGLSLKLSAKAQVMVIYQYVGASAPYINRVTVSGTDFQFEIYEAIPYSTFSYQIDEGASIASSVDGVGQCIIPASLAVGWHSAVFTFQDTTEPVNLNFMVE